ncbi:MAG: glycosyltransferase [Bdellovibrionota bacterium]
MPEDNYKLTVNIVTHGRLELFKRCLNSCLQSLPPHAEVLVLVNGGDPSTVEYLKSFSHPALRWEATPASSLSRCRNHSLEIAKGRVLYCLDDDVEVPKRLFERALLRFETDADLCVLGGPNLTPPHSTLKQKLFGAVMTSWFAAPWVRRRYGAISVSRKNAGEFDLMFCNLAIAIRRIPSWMRFEEGLRSNQENAFVDLCSKKNLATVFDDDLFVYHHRRTELLSFLRQIASYGYGRFQQMALHWQTSPAVFLVPPLVYPLALLLMWHGKWPWLGALAGMHQALALLALFGAGTEIRSLGWRRLYLAPLTAAVHLAYGYGFWKALLERLIFRPESARVQPPVVESRKRFEAS